MALRRANLDIVIPGATTIEAESDIRVDGLPGRMLTFTFKDDDASFRGRWAVALPAPEMYLQISYVIPASDAKAGQRFSHICESVVPARKTPAHDALAGLAQGTAVDVTLAARRWLTQRYLLAPGDGLIPVFGAWVEHHSMV
jgi:hypothetical protein